MKWSRLTSKEAEITKIIERLSARKIRIIFVSVNRSQYKVTKNRTKEKGSH
ncbi:hypothetical protein GCM10008934_11270 [Virgibacillus salarius]